MDRDQLRELEDLRATVTLIRDLINDEQNERIRGGRANWKRACDRIFNEVDGRAS